MKPLCDVGKPCYLKRGYYYYKGSPVKVTDIVDYIAYVLVEIEPEEGCMAYILWNGRTGEWVRSKKNLSW